MFSFIEKLRCGDRVACCWLAVKAFGGGNEWVERSNERVEGSTHWVGRSNEWVGGSNEWVRRSNERLERSTHWECGAGM